MIHAIGSVRPVLAAHALERRSEPLRKIRLAKRRSGREPV